jgi:hypothetical protein
VKLRSDVAWGGGANLSTQEIGKQIIWYRGVT